MKIITTIFFCFLLTAVYSKNVTFNIENKLPSSILVKVFKGGKLDNLPLTQEKLGEQTILIGEKKPVIIKIKRRDIVSVTAEFPNGSKYLFWSGQVNNQKEIEIIIDDSKFEIRNKPEEYLKNLQSNLYKDQDVEFIVEKTNSNASDVFNSHLGGLGILIINNESGTEKIKEIDLISPNVLGNAEEPKFVKDRARNFTYTLSSNIVTENKANIPGIADIDFDFRTDKLYQFNYSMVGFGKIIYTDPDGESIEERWSELDEVTKNSFLRTYLSAVAQYQNDGNTRIEVRLYNRGIGFKGMYMRIEEFQKNNLAGNVSASSFYSNQDAYAKSEREEYEDVFGEYVLAVGCKGQNKTAWIAYSSQQLVEKMVTDIKTHGLPEAFVEGSDIKIFEGAINLQNITQDELLENLYNIKEKLGEIEREY